ncbi:MAG: lipoate--protein ligase family protein, partial [Candidatus Rokubacteria bacterium]|nr:lipoate--protein ligase family protein [Candidatus Rokubacteria bacterium]
MAETRWRLLVTEPLDGAHNMALDEAILLARIRGIAPPTLRFFSWTPPTISLGYGQKLDARINSGACRRLGVGLVRRPTGGSAIYHDTLEREVTYSVVARVGDFDGSGDLLETYRWIGAGLTAGLQRLGAPAEMVAVRPSDPSSMPTFCFSRTGSFEVEVGGKKLVGSAQRRQGGAFLQHGSILLGADVGRFRLLFPQEGDPLVGMTTLEDVLGRRPAFDEVAQALTAGLRETHELDLAPGGLTRDEEALMERLRREKYSTESWTASGHPITDLSFIA